MPRPLPLPRTVVRACGAGLIALLAGGAVACDTAVIKAISGDVIVTGPDGVPVTALPEVCLPVGARLVTGPGGRVTFFVVARDTVIDLDRNSELVLPQGAEPDRVTLRRGVLNFLSSVRGNFAVQTPYLTAGIEGTEATVHADPGAGAVVITREGVVTPSRDGATLPGPPGLTPGEIAFAPVAGPVIRVGRDDAARLPEVFRPYVIAPDQAADWAVYVPPALLADPARAGDVAAAALIAARDPRAAAAQLDCGGAAQSPLCTMLAVALNDRPRIATLADRQGDGMAGLVAQSHALQALGRLEEARAVAAAALAAEGGAALRAHALARLAELDLILGNPAAARESAAAAVAAGAPLGTTLLGFVALAELDPTAAEAQFDAAIRAGDASPLPFLGRGLARIRMGRQAEGRGDIETAAALDPQRADLRGWLGRAYLEEGLTAKAQSQLALAKARDPDDPGPFLTSAGERFAANDPIAALREIEAAERLSGTRATLRGRDGLGEDQAARSAALGRVFDVLGFEERARELGALATEREPLSAAANRFFADTLRGQPGSGIAQASAYLRYQILSPPSKDPLQPELGEAGLGLLDTSGPARVTFAEFAPLFQTNGPRFDIAGLGGTQNTLGGATSFVVLQDRLSFGVGQFHYETEGYRDNNQVRHDVQSAQVKAQVSPDLTIFGEYRFRDTAAGDRALEFDLVPSEAQLRTDITTSRARLGLHARLPEGLEGIAFFEYLNAEEALSLNQGLRTDRTRDAEGFNLQASLTRDWGMFDTTLGFSAAEISGRDALPGSGFALDTEERFLSAWAYLTARPWDWLDLTAGLAVDSVRDDGSVFLDRTVLSPKLGVRTALGPNLDLRLAYTRSMTRNPLLVETLEPVTVAGFDQTYRYSPGTVIDQIGAGIDARLPGDIRAGAQAVFNWRDVPSRSSGFTADGQRDQIFGVWATRSFGDRLAASVALNWEESWGDASSAALARFTTIEAPLRLRYFHPDGWFAGADVTFVHHQFRDRRERRSNAGAVVVDASLGYRLPENRGIFTLEVKNALGAAIRIEDEGLLLNDPVAPRFARGTTVLAGFRMSF